MMNALLAITTLALSQGEIKGQAQLPGINGDFGQTYSLQNGFNLTVLSAAYSVEPFDGYNVSQPKSEEKQILVDFAIKNARSEDNFLDSSGLFVAVDEKGELYSSSEYGLQSRPGEAPDFTLRPGQGLGQVALKDPLRVRIVVPGNARINKIMVNQGRLNTQEKVIRFLMVEPPKVVNEKSPKNFIAPLPENVRDSADKWGAIALAEGKAKMGEAYPSGTFRLRVESLTPGARMGENEPGEGKHFVMATMTVTHVLKAPGNSFDLGGGDTPLYQLTDTDGERYPSIGLFKPKADEAISREFQKGDTYTVRVFFEVPKESKLRSLRIGAGDSRMWTIEL